MSPLDPKWALVSPNEHNEPNELVYPDMSSDERQIRRTMLWLILFFEPFWSTMSLFYPFFQVSPGEPFWALMRPSEPQWTPVSPFKHLKQSRYILTCLQMTEKYVGVGNGTRGHPLTPFFLYINRGPSEPF